MLIAGWLVAIPPRKSPTLTYPSDVNDAYSWNGYTPTVASFTDPTTGMTVDTVTTTPPDDTVTGAYCLLLRYTSERSGVPRRRSWTWPSSTRH